MSEPRRWGRAGPCRPRPKHRNIAASRQLDRQRIAPAFARVILAQPQPEPAGFGPHDRILLGIVTRGTAENFDRNQGFLQFLVPALQMPPNYEPQKPGQPLVAREAAARQDPFQLPPYGLRLRFER